MPVRTKASAKRHRPREVLHAVRHGIVLVRLDIPEDVRRHLDILGWRCTRIMNGMVMDWYARQCGRPKTTAQASAALGKASESTLLYHAGMEMDQNLPGDEAVRLGSRIISCLARKLSAYLSGRMPWRREYMVPDGEEPPKKRSEAILRGIIRPPFYQGCSIPIHNERMELMLTDRYELKVRQGPLHLDIQLGTRNLNYGQRRALLRFARKVDRLPCAELVRCGRKWLLRLPVSREVSSTPNARCLILKPGIYSTWEQARQGWPLRAEGPEEVWGPVGWGRDYWRRQSGLTLALKMLGMSYRHGEMRGRGRQRVERVRQRLGKARRGTARVFRHQCIQRVMELARMWGCHNVLYYEPSVPLRGRTWFGQAGVDWDWGLFRQDLENACARRGMRLQVSLLRCADTSGPHGSEGD